MLAAIVRFFLENKLVVWLRCSSADVKSGMNEARQNVTDLVPSGPTYRFPDLGGDDNQWVKKEVQHSAHVGPEGIGREALPI